MAIGQLMDMAPASEFDEIVDRFPAPDLASAADALLVPTGFLMSLSDVQTREQALDVFSDWAPGAIGADRCSIALPDAAKEHLIVRTVNGAEGIPEGTVYSLHNTIIGTVYLK